MNKTKKNLLLSLIFVTLNAHADLPLTVKNVISDSGQLKLETNLSYVNSNTQTATGINPILVQTGTTSFVQLPTIITDQKSNSDVLVDTAGLRYGISANLEAYSRASYLARFNRFNKQLTDNDTVPLSERSHQWQDAWLGVNYKIKDDTNTPALFLFGEAALYEYGQSNHSYLKSYLLGMTTYHSIDPVVLSVSAACRTSNNRQNGTDDIKPGNILFINPSVAFAVNDKVSLTTGFSWTLRQATIINGQKIDTTSTSTDLNLGLGFGLTDATNLAFNFRTSASGNNDAEMRFNLIHTFGYQRKTVTPKVE